MRLRFSILLFLFYFAAAGLDAQINSLLNNPEERGTHAYELEMYFREESNKLANEIDRDYLIIVDVYGYHSVSKKKSKERVDPDKLKGNVTLVVSIVNAATGVAEVTKRKSTEGKNPGKINEEDLLKDLELLVDKVYQKFVKNFKG